jgi:hypothetical protein
MAKQKGIIKLEGTIGDITFHKSKDGYIAKEKTSLSPDRIATDPAFARTRENGAEFGRAGKAGKTLRNSLRSALQRARDGRMVGRLTKEMTKVIKADTTNGRGMRNVIDGDIAMLTGFEFNIDAKLTTKLYAPFTAAINRTTGEVSVTLQPFVPTSMIASPSGTTHFRIMATASEVDFDSGVFSNDLAESAMLPWNQAPTAALTLTCNLPAASTQVLFLAVGIEFFQEVNGTQYPLNNGSYNALSLVQVDVA